jgi:hypothetical protein
VGWVKCDVLLFIILMHFISKFLGVRFVLAKGPNKVDVSLLSPEGRSRSDFRNIVFPIYLEFRTMGKVQKSNISEDYLGGTNENCDKPNHSRRSK